MRERGPFAGGDLTPLLGRVVGVEGQTRFHPGLKLRVITVSRADALTAAE